MTGGYESVRRLIHENLLPALERCSVIISRLRGLSRFHETSNMLGLSTQSLNNILDVVNCLNLMAHSILIYAGEELRQFTAFSVWLRHEIDVQAADPTSSSDDPADKDLGIEYARVLDYIHGAMTATTLTALFAPALQEDTAQIWLQNEGTLVYSSFKAELDKFNSASRLQSKLPNVDHLTSHLQRQCDVVFEQIAVAQRQNVLFRSPQILALDTQQALDARMLFEV